MSFIIIPDFWKDFDVEAHNNVWTVEVFEGGMKKSVKKTTTGIVPRLEESWASDRWVKIADFDTFISFNGKHESQIVQNAIEQGQFRSVNKIKKPTVCTVELAKGGMGENIQTMLDNLIRYKEGLNIIRVRTPFGTIENVNLIGLDYSFRQGDCASMLVAKLQLQEVQSGKATLEYSIGKIKNPENTNTQDTGIAWCERDVVGENVDLFEKMVIQ